MRKPKGIFITATDTGVGKTVVSVGLALALKEQGIKVGVMKPVATGCYGSDQRLIAQDAVCLFEASENEFSGLTSPVRYKNPLAPMVAASLENKEVDLKKIHEAFLELQHKYDFIIVEGVGGLLVPLTKDYFVTNLIRDFNLPLIVVARPGLGTINHTLLTLEAASVRGFKVRGIIFNRVPVTNLSLAEMTSPKAIHDISGVPILGSLPDIEGMDMDNCRFGKLKEVFTERIHIEKIMHSYEQLV